MGVLFSAEATGLEGAWRNCRTQGSGWLEYREQAKNVWGKIREGKTRWGTVGRFKEFGLSSQSSGKPLQNLSRGIT